MLGILSFGGSIASKSRHGEGALLATARVISLSTKAALSASRPNVTKVIVANRGEIACRIIRTCKRLRIPTVAVYSLADGPRALHARMADEAYLIGIGPSATESYLRQNDLLEIAQRSGADFLHPGYGFLSENAGFAEKVQNAGLTFIGPPPSAIQAMGSKSQSKAIMESAGVPTTPGYYGDGNQDADFLLEKAIQIGFPVLIKAVMGGGGKGMRLIWTENDFKDGLESCRRESQASFGDSTVLLEKYLVRPRHVEVQVIADTHGNAVYLFERDCSLQRRHQKIIEEAPASDFDDAMRSRLGQMGTTAAKAVGYVNAGTVEFLLDTQQPDQFYFCEMNTRLQVEHPVTELITGVDLVEWQLRIAAGEELPVKDQSGIAVHGHAFEARIYAENPAKNFLPGTGNVWHHNPPVEINTGISSEGVRVDTGLMSGQNISVYYDPMISKLIVHGENRENALNKLIDSLKNYQIAGVPTNIDFLIKCADHQIFRQAGKINTGFLEDYAEDVRMLEDEYADPSPLARVIGSFAILLQLEKRVGVSSTVQVAPWSSLSGSWRIGGATSRAKRILELDNGNPITCVSNRDGSFDVIVPSDAATNKEDVMYHISGQLSFDGEMDVVVNHTNRIKLRAVMKNDHGLIRIRMWPQGLKDYRWEMNIKNPNELAFVDAILARSGEGAVKAPMPGKVSRVNFSVGDKVTTGDVVVVMEAMKMEHAIKAPYTGSLTEINCKVNDLVDDGAILLMIKGDQVDS